MRKSKKSPNNYRVEASAYTMQSFACRLPSPGERAW